MNKTGRGGLQGGLGGRNALFQFRTRSVCDAYGHPSAGIEQTILYALGIHMSQWITSINLVVTIM